MDGSQDAVQVVATLYRALLGRQADAAGLEVFAQRLASGFYKNEEDLAKVFLNSSEYLVKNQELFHRLRALDCEFLWPAGAIFTKGGDYEKWALPYFLDHCRTGMTVLDIGAAWGIYAIPAAKRVAPGGWVYAVEVSSRNCKILHQSALVNGIDNLEILPFGLSDHLGSEQLRRKNAGDPNNVIRSGEDWVQERFATIDIIPVISLDLLSPAFGRVDLIKADIEGMEYRVFNAGRRLLNEQKPTVFIEYSPNFQQYSSGVDGGELLKIFLELDYSIEILHRQSERELVTEATANDIITRVDRVWHDHVAHERGTHLDLRLFINDFNK
jgi:FkbM family methyltransferase